MFSMSGLDNIFTMALEKKKPKKLERSFKMVNSKVNESP